MGKKKGKSGGKKGRKVVDGISTAEMSREQLLGHIKRLQSEIDREREERNFFMLEREKLFSLWSLALEKINEEKDKARLREIQLDDVRESKEEDMKLQKQKVRYLMSEQLKKLGETRLDYLYRIRDHQIEFGKVEATLREKVQDVKSEASTTRACLFQTVRDLQIQKIQDVSTVRRDYASEVRRLEVESDLRVVKCRDRFELESKQDLIQLQIIKDEQIHQLIQVHAEQLNQLKDYYTDIITNNLALITTLRDELAESKSREAKVSSELERCKVNKQQFKEKVQQLELKMVEWTEQEKKMASRITQVQRMDKKVNQMNKELKHLETVNEALFQKTLEEEKEKAFLKKFLAKSLMESQRKSTMSQILQKAYQKSQNSTIGPRRTSSLF